MQKLLTAIVMGLSFVSFASSLEDQGSVDVLKFMQSIVGRYEVLTVNQIPPHSKSIAEIAIENSDETDWAMPLCLKNTCIPGFLNFPFKNTQVFEQASDGNDLRFMIVTLENNIEKKYYWRESAGKFYFKNPQFDLPNNKVGEVEHELKKLTD